MPLPMAISNWRQTTTSSFRRTGAMALMIIMAKSNEKDKNLFVYVMLSLHYYGTLLETGTIKTLIPSAAECTFFG